jgi:hypothetical protein
MTSTVDFNYSIDDGGQSVVITVTCDATTANSTGLGTSYSVLAISGTVNGASITGEDGASASVQTANGFIFDNAIFINQADGVDGNIDGIDNDGLLFDVNGIYYNLFSQDGALVLASYPNNDISAAPTIDTVTVTSTDAPCFCAGTMMATPTGEAAVEALAIGDDVLTADGAPAKVRWIGRRKVARRFADPLTSLPIRIRAGAIAEASPARDLLVSPDHAVLVDGILVNAGALVNGVSILREQNTPETFTYYHIELEQHALVLAEGLAAETFIDNVDRMAFDNWAERETLLPASAPPEEMVLPRAKSHRQVPSSIRARLLRRGVELDGKADGRRSA